MMTWREKLNLNHAKGSDKSDKSLHPGVSRAVLSLLSAVPGGFENAFSVPEEDRSSEVRASDISKNEIAAVGEEDAIRQAQRLNVFGQELAALLLAYPSSQAEFLQRASRRGIPHMDTQRFLSNGVQARLIRQDKGVYSWVGPLVPTKIVTADPNSTDSVREEKEVGGKYA
jgi:hypothetical protein